MKEEWSFKQYEVFAKEKLFRVVVFPNVEGLYCYDAYPTESTYDIDGSAGAMSYLAAALYTILRNQNLIVYLPIKKDLASFHLVICGNRVKRFRPSVWYKIKKWLKSRNRIQDYKMLLDFSELRKGKAGEYTDFFYQKELGDTVFCKFAEDDLITYINLIIKGIKRVEEEPGVLTQCWGMGFVISEKLI